MTPTWQTDDGRIQLYCGDCLKILPEIGKVDAVITDPPYGMNWNGKVTVGKNGHGKKGQRFGHYGVTIANDDKPFDPSPFLGFKTVIMFGYNHFADKLPKGTLWVWLKRYDDGFEKYLSDAEIAWMNRGHGIYCKRSTEMQATANQRTHPTQKPVEIMKWLIEKNTNGSDTILDPFMGSGTTGIACIRTGRKFIGIEISPEYFEIAKERIKIELQQQLLNL
jgi:site-specific DNA-methyltransferase (adenine-specific)